MSLYSLPRRRFWRLVSTRLSHRGLGCGVGFALINVGMTFRSANLRICKIQVRCVRMAWAAVWWNMWGGIGWTVARYFICYSTLGSDFSLRGRFAGGGGRSLVKWFYYRSDWRRRVCRRVPQRHCPRVFERGSSTIADTAIFCVKKWYNSTFTNHQFDNA